MTLNLNNSVLSALNPEGEFNLEGDEGLFAIGGVSRVDGDFLGADDSDDTIDGSSGILVAPELLSSWAMVHLL